MEEITVKEMANWKATPRDNVILNISNGAPIQVGDGSDHNRNYNFSMLPDNDLSIPCYFLAAIPSLKMS